MTRTDSTICPSCGKTVVRDSHFCEHCAFNLTTLHESAKWRGNLIGILALSLGLLLLIAYFVWRKNTHANQTQASQFDLTAEKVSALTRTQMIKDVEARLPKEITSFGHF